MPADPCLVTVRAGPGASKGYENFVSNKLKDEVLKEITSNLQDELKEEALEAFKATVQDGWSIKDCICKVQNEVLPKVPNERNKFFIKFNYDNQLQIEIGVNKFKNGNAQFYHKIGIAPKEDPEVEEHKEEHEKRKEVLEEMTSEETFQNIRLKRQTTNDKSAPFVSGKRSNPSGGWDAESETEVNVPPNPTNIQTALACTDWIFDPPLESKSSRRRALGDLYRSKKPSASHLRCRSVGRSTREDSEDRPMERHRSISPFGSVGIGARSPFQDLPGILRSKAKLRPTGSHTVHRGSFKTGRRFSITKENKDSDSINNVEIHVEREHRPYDIETEESGESLEPRDSSGSSEANEDDYSNENEGREDMPETEEEKTQSMEQELEIRYPIENIFVDETVEDDVDNHKNVWYINNLETEETYKQSHKCEPECKIVDMPCIEEHPLQLQSLKEFHLPDQTLFKKKIEPLPSMEEFEKWFRPLKERSQDVSTAVLEVSSNTQSSKDTAWKPFMKESWGSKPGRGL